MPIFRELVELAPRVYMFPHDETPNTIQPNIGVLRLDNQTVLIDSGNSPRHARQIMAAMAGSNFAPIETIIYTHHHWDHTFAASTFNASQVIAHARTIDYMGNYALRQWNAPALREAIYHNPRLEVSYNAMIDAIPDWREFRVIVPTMAFSRTLRLHYDEMPLELEAVDGRHAPDSIVVRIPQAGILFLGDCYYPPPLHLRGEDDIDLHVPMLESLVSEEYDLYIDGHGPPRNRHEMDGMIAQEKKRQGWSS